jgi:hypothetical protein
MASFLVRSAPPPLTLVVWSCWHVSRKADTRARRLALHFYRPLSFCNIWRRWQAGALGLCRAPFALPRFHCGASDDRCTAYLDHHEGQPPDEIAPGMLLMPHAQPVFEAACQVCADAGTQLLRSKHCGGLGVCSSDACPSQSLLYVLCYRMEAFSDSGAQVMAALRSLPLDRQVLPVTACPPCAVVRRPRLCCYAAGC